MKMLDLNNVKIGTYSLPWNGLEWEIPEPSAKDALRLRALAWSDAYTPDVEIEEIQKILGPVWDDVIEMGISWPKLMHMGRTAVIWATSTEEAARAYWNLRDFTALVMDLDAARKAV